MKFGRFVKARREELLKDDRSYSLRRVAMKIGIEPSYLSKIEREIVPPPSEEKILSLASVLNEDEDVLLAMAGKVSSALLDIIKERPVLFAELIRTLKEEPDHAVLRVVREVKDGNW